MSGHRTLYDAFDNTVWKITPFHVPQLDIAPPQNLVNLTATSVEDRFLWGEYELYDSPDSPQTCSEELHEELVSQSLREYGDIWKLLATM